MDKWKEETERLVKSSYRDQSLDSDRGSLSDAAMSRLPDVEPWVDDLLARIDASMAG